MAKIDAPPPGSTVEQVTRTRILSAVETETPQPDKTDLWEYMAGLSPDAWTRHILYVYRWLENGEKEFVAKYTQNLDEQFLRERHGGGSYRLMLKNGPQIWKTIERVRVEGPPKAVEEKTPVRSAEDSSAVNRLCDLLERMLANNPSTALQNDALKSSLEMQRDAFRGVVTDVRSVLQPAPAATPADDLTRQLLQAAISKLLNPSDPIETFAKMMSAMKGLGFDGGSAKSSVGAELVRAVGGAIPQIMDGVKSYTLAVTKQAELEMMRLSHGIRPQPAAAPQPQPVPPAVPVQTIPPQQPAAEPQEKSVIRSIDDVEKHIASLMMDQNASARDAANNILDFIEDVSPNNLYPYICSLDEPTLMAFINSRPGLNGVPRDPRFAEIIHKIVELTHAVDNSADTSASKPA
jgi:hypothetical protein